MKVRIVAACDEGFAQHLAVMLPSAGSPTPGLAVNVG